MNGRYFIHYQYKREFESQIIRCCLPQVEFEGDIESGERLEALSFYKNFTKLTIGIEASFAMEDEYGHDYSGKYLKNGIEYQSNPLTGSQIFLFGVSWIRPCTEENDHQTWYGSDPTLKR